jgi:hypothetical protein
MVWCCAAIMAALSVGPRSHHHAPLIILPCLNLNNVLLVSEADKDMSTPQIVLFYLLVECFTRRGHRGEVGEKYHLQRHFANLVRGLSRLESQNGFFWRSYSALQAPGRLKAFLSGLVQLGHKLFIFSVSLEFLFKFDNLFKFKNVSI